MQDLAVTFIDSITAIGPDDWNSLTGTDNPFMRYEFLHALENTGCTTQRTGWQPRHVVVRRVNPSLDELVAVMPLYEKTNSYGEYVFDWAWANAYQQYGYDYYPKFVTSAPFTPSTGRRIFHTDDVDTQALIGLIKNAIEERADFIRASSWHVLFPTEQEHAHFTDNNMLARTACQFHWFNRDYQSFDDFLQTMSSRKRKNLKKERQKVTDAGITFIRLEGNEISNALWNDFYTFYQSTYMMRGMQGYLSVEFFLEVAQTMPEQLFMVCAQQGDNTIATALFFKGSQNLYGRYWGSAADYQFLHFETCYYQGQEYAIEHGFKLFDSGAQGEHKIQRGFEPVITYSNHWIADEAFRDAIARFLEEEKPHIERYRNEARSLLPFKSESVDLSKKP